MRADRARAAVLRAELDAYRHPRPLDEVWQEARVLLHEGHHGLAGKDLEAVGVEGPKFLITLFSPARETTTGPAGERVMETGFGPGVVRRRYHVEGQGGPAGSRVIFVAIVEDPTEHGRDGRDRARDLEMELALVRRLDPGAADRIDRALGAARP
jgi:hypothetical protein